MDKPLVSLCMIVKNEEDVIAHCLQSVKEAVDELIVIDTGSTDRTIEIAESEGASVHTREWHQDFAAARNESIDLASGSWILVLDADESLEEGHGKMLRQLITDNPAADGFFVRIHNFFGTESKQTGSSVSASMRLFRNKPAYRYSGRIHEQIVQPILSANPSATLLHSHIRLNHGGYLPDVVQKKNKVQRNTELLLEELKNSDNESFHRYNLGIEYMRANNHAAALEQLRQCRALTDWRLASFGHIAMLREVSCLMVLGQWEEAAELCSFAANELNDYPDMFFTLGRIYYHLRQWQQAEAAFHKALAIGVAPPNYTSVSGMGTYSASFQLGKTREQMEDYEGAIHWYVNALKFNSNLLSPFLRLISLLTRLYDASSVTEKIEHLFHLESPRTWWSIALSYYQLGLYEQAVDILHNRQLPAEKKEDRQMLLIRCSLLSPNATYKLDKISGSARRWQNAKKLFYTALASNDDMTALKWLTRMEQMQASGQQTDPASALILNLHTYLLNGKTEAVPLNLPATAYAALWSELYFLYMLAAKEHLFALQAQIQAYWHQLMTTLPDPVLRLKGRFELVKTVHVRIYQIFQHEDSDPAYKTLWNDVKPRLLTLIDDLLMEEVN